MIRSLFFNSKIGFLIGTVLGIIISIVAITASEKSGIGHTNTNSKIYMLIMTIFIPYILSGCISGVLTENIFINKLILSTQFFSKNRIGSIVGCILGGTCFFYLLLSFGLIGGILVGGIFESLLGPKSASIGMCLGTLITSVVLILSGGFIGLAIGGLSEKIIRTVI